jgi:hypothetical protein
MAASIPVLRVLFVVVREGSGRGGYYTRGTGPSGGRSSGKRNHQASLNITVTEVSAKRKSPSNIKDVSNGDSSSARSILPDEAPNGRIMRRDEVVVNYEDERPSNLSEYELDEIGGLSAPPRVWQQGQRPHSGASSLV